MNVKKEVDEKVLKIMYHQKLHKLLQKFLE